MPGHHRLLTLIAGAVLFATFVFALMAAPGFLSDIDSIEPAHRLAAAPPLEAGR